VASRDQHIARVKKNIQHVSKVKHRCRVLLYGRNGKGKTRIAASATQGRTLIVDANEEGTMSVQQYPNCYVHHCKKWSDLTYVYWYLREGDHRFETVVIDTLTQVQKLCMSAVLKIAEDRDPNRPPKTPVQRDWNQMTERMKTIIFDYRNLPMNVVFVCQEKIDKTETEDGELYVRYVPDLSPAVRGDAMSAVAFIGRVYRKPVRVGKGKREKIKWETRMLVGDHDDYETKDRSGMLGHIVRNPTMDMMIEAAQHVKEEEEE